MVSNIYNLSNKNVTLTSYILDSSKEMAHFNKRPAILICPGGAYKFCSDREGEPIAMHFLSMGYNVFVLRYSLNENSMFPKPLEDAEEAMQFILDNANGFNVDVENIAVCGFSAGGHLAASLGILGKNKPKAMILGYPCISENICNEIDCLANKGNLPVLDKLVDVNTPPAFIFLAKDDGTVPINSSLDLEKALKEHGVPCELHIFEKGGHGFATGDYVTCQYDGYSKFDTYQWILHCKEWLYKIFR